MSFVQPHTYKGHTYPEACFKLKETNGDFYEERARVTLVVHPSITDKNTKINILESWSWDLGPTEQIDSETGAVVAPAFAAVFGLDDERQAIDSRKQMYLFIRSLPPYAQAVDLVP